MRISSGLLQEIIRKENTQMHIVLHEPEIPGNTGNIGRSCAATNTSLHLIEPLGFYITEKELRRAGMDYWSQLDVHRYRDYEDFLLENFGTISPRPVQQDGLDGYGLEDRRRTENKIVTPAAPDKNTVTSCSLAKFSAKCTDSRSKWPAPVNANPILILIYNL